MVTLAGYKNPGIDDSSCSSGHGRELKDRRVTRNETNNHERLFEDGPASQPTFDCMAEVDQSDAVKPSRYAVHGVEGDISAGGQGETSDLPEDVTAVCHSARDNFGERQFPSFSVLEVRVDAVQMPEALERLRFWIEDARTITRYVAVTGMHGIAESRQNRQFRDVLNAADLVVPDGMPLVWLGRIQGFPLQNRVCGSELMDEFCCVTGSAYRHFFFGGAPGVAQKLARVLEQKYGIGIAGTYTPPFRALTDAEEIELARLVEETLPDVLWVGLSTPKQEKWMYEHRNKLKVPVMLGVGAAFDMNCGNLRRAPAWMRRSGLEWLFRLVSEPRRLWKRYLITIPQAVWSICIKLPHVPSKREPT
jgi:N-acetylglucosaminyldiphosphoundecaprenol N-acetyl-beta-D-mannosaminyltransferase